MEVVILMINDELVEHIKEAEAIIDSLVNSCHGSFSGDTVPVNIAKGIIETFNVVYDYKLIADIIHSIIDTEMNKQSNKKIGNFTRRGAEAMIFPPALIFDLIATKRINDFNEEAILRCIGISFIDICIELTENKIDFCEYSKDEAREGIIGIYKIVKEEYMVCKHVGPAMKDIEFDGLEDDESGNATIIYLKEEVGNFRFKHDIKNNIIFISHLKAYKAYPSEYFVRGIFELTKRKKVKLIGVPSLNKPEIYKAIGNIGSIEEV